MLVPILIEEVEMPLEFENLQAANLTSWNTAASPPELEAVFERIQALAPVPHDRLARAAVRAARRDFAAGRRAAAIAKLEQFRPVHDLVSRALAELRAEVDRIELERAEADRVKRERAEADRIERERAEAGRIERERAEAARLGAEAAQRQRDLAEHARFEELPLHKDDTVETVPPAARPSRSTTRPAQIAIAAAVVMSLIVAAWGVRIWRGRSTTARPLPQARTLGPEKPVASTPIENPSSTPPRIAAVQPAVDAVPNTPVAPNEPAASAPGTPVLPAKRLEELRTRARAQQQSGEHTQALNSVVEGLQIDPRDSGLRKMLDSMLRDAQASAQQAKQAAIDADAEATAEEAFGRAALKEREAVRLRREGKLDAATRSFLVAAAQFSTAGRLAEEEAEQARVAEARRKKEVPPIPNNPAERKTLDTAAERELATEMLRRYEAAYGTLKAENIKSIYPAAPIDELAKELAEYRSYSLKITPADFTFVSQADGRILGRAPCRVTYDIVPKSGPRTQGERSQTFLLEKPGGKTWIIVGIR